MGLSLLLGRQTQLLLTTLRSSCTTEPPSLSSSSAWLLFRQGSTLEIRFSALLMGCLVEQWTSTAGFTQHSQFPGLGEKSTRSFWKNSNRSWLLPQTATNRPILQWKWTRRSPTCRCRKERKEEKRSERRVIKEKKTFQRK